MGAPGRIRVYPAIAVVQLREDLYPQASEFRPERYLEEGAESYAWLPFGGGIRRCIGAALAQAEMAEVIRAVVGPGRARADPARARTGGGCAASPWPPGTARRSGSAGSIGKFPSSLLTRNEELAGGRVAKETSLSEASAPGIPSRCQEPRAAPS